MYNELIDALRHCGNGKRYNECPMGNPSSECFKMLLAAADAIEKLGKEIVELEARISSLEYELAEAYCN